MQPATLVIAMATLSSQQGCSETWFLREITVTF